MTRHQLFILLLSGFLPLLLSAGCDSGSSRPSDDPEDNASDGDADSDADSDSDSDSDSDGDVDSGNKTFREFGDVWHGYAWPEVGRSDVDEISPDSFGDLADNDKLCAKGTLAKDGIGSYGMIAFNIRQDKDKSPGAIPLEGDGVTVSLDIETGHNLYQLELHGPATGDDEPGKMWCHNIIGEGGTYRFEDFTTRCYNNLNPGDAYKGDPIEFISVTVPGNLSAIPFDFCIADIVPEETIEINIEEQYPVKDGEICMDTGKENVYTQDPPVAYKVTNNVWNSTGGEQCVTYDNNSFEVTTQTNSSGNSTPTGYPSIIYGAKTQSEITKYSKLPKKVSELGKVTTHWSNNAGGPSGTYNAAYDVWFNDNEEEWNEVGDQGDLPTAAYLMVWFHSQGGITPIPSDTGQRVTIGGVSWEVWTGSPGPSGAKHIAYVATGKTDLTFDLKDFIDDAVDRGVVSNSYYLSAIQAGFEIWSGGKGLKTTEFRVDEDSI